MVVLAQVAHVAARITADRLLGHHQLRRACIDKIDCLSVIDGLRCGASMALEIERKFLVANDAWKSSITRSVHIRDGLIASENGRKARVRIADSQATIALKSRRCGPIRSEFEYAIPLSDAEEMLRVLCDGRILDKTRHCVSFMGATWNVDVYEGVLSGVVLAEVELGAPNQDPPLPEWVGKEVTGDPSYRKINMLAQRMGGDNMGGNDPLPPS